MSSDDRFESAEAFLEQMDRGLLDGTIIDAFQSLSSEQMEAVATVLTERSRLRLREAKIAIS